MRFSGLLLTDSSLTPVASNRAARAILGYSDRSGMKKGLVSAVPKEALERIRRANSDEALAFLTSLRAGSVEYTCRVYFMDLYTNDRRAAERILAFVIDKDRADKHLATSDVAIHFNLTEREREVFKWLCLGLTDKQIADKMHISPNTVKCFVRFIMIKMGVGTRTGVMAKILAHTDCDIGADNGALPRNEGGSGACAE
jgi:DNA-binding CsgD family transcriptional regulator